MGHFAIFDVSGETIALLRCDSRAEVMAEVLRFQLRFGGIFGYRELTDEEYPEELRKCEQREDMKRTDHVGSLFE